MGLGIRKMAFSFGSVLILVSCGPIASLTPTPSATLPATVTPALPSPTFAYQPSTPVFPYIATPYLGMPFAPTPIAQPEMEWSNYRLKNWLELDALELVRSTDQYVFNADRMWFSSTRPFLEQYQDAISFPAEEMLYRYPETSYREALMWHQAKAAAIKGDNSYIPWVLDQIESALNRGEIDRDSITTFLAPRGFDLYEINYPEKKRWNIPNVFGDGREGELLNLTAAANLYWTNTIFVLSREPGNLYRVDLIADFSNRLVADIFDYGIEPFQDNNRNGKPEIPLNDYGRLFIYEWNGERFVEITNGGISLGGRDDNLESVKYVPDPSGIPTLQFSIQEMFQPHAVYVYVWDGQSYILSEKRLSYTRFYLSAYDFLETGYDLKAYEPLSEQIDENISTSTDLTEPGAIGFLKFQKAFLYALQDNGDSAIVSLMDILDSQESSSTSAVYKATISFLQNYQQPGDIYVACIQANQQIDSILGFHYREKYLESEKAMELLGYDPQLLRFPFCDSASAFRYLVEKANRDQFSTLPSILKGNGVSFRNIESADLNADGVTDWLFVLSDLQVWAVLDSTNGIQTIMLDTGRGNNGQVSIEIVDTVTGQWPFVVVLSRGFLNIYQLYALTDRCDATRFFPWTDETISFDVQVKDSTFEIIARNSVFPTWQGFQFDPIKKDFVQVSRDRTRQEKLALLAVEVGENLFSGNPSDAVPMLRDYVTLPPKPCDENDWLCQEEQPDTARMFYLLGLAYELSGDEANAVMIYWQLWRDYPDSPYAVMAKSKLEPVAQ